MAVFSLRAKIPALGIAGVNVSPKLGVDYDSVRTSVSLDCLNCELCRAHFSISNEDTRPGDSECFSFTFLGENSESLTPREIERFALRFTEFRVKSDAARMRERITLER